MTQPQEKVLKCVNEREVIALAKNLIKIPSFTTRESACAKFLASFMEERGFNVELQEVEEGRFQTLGRIKGTGEGPSLMYNGHIDIDPLASGWTKDPWKPVIVNGRLYGAGILNMKAGVTAMVMAADAVRKLGIQLKGDLIVAAVVGELQGGVGTKHLLERGLRPDMAVVTEPTDLDVITIHAGVMEIAIHTIGRSVHISSKEAGVDAIQKMVKVIQALNSMRFTYKPKPDLSGLPRMLIGSIIGGRGKDYELRGPYNVSDLCTILVDIRFLPSQSVETIRKDIEDALEKLKKEDPDLEYRIEIPPDPKYRCARVIMEPFDAPLDETIVKTVVQSHERVTGSKVKRVGGKPPFSYCGNDTTHLWKLGIPCCLYGPGRWDATTTGADRFVEVEHITMCTKTLALTALDLCTKTRKELGIKS